MDPKALLMLLGEDEPAEGPPIPAIKELVHVINALEAEGRVKKEKVSDTS